MTELETLLLQQLKQQQRDSETLVKGLSEQLEKLRIALSNQQAESKALRQEIIESDQRNAQAISAMTKRFEELSQRLSILRKRSNG